MKRILALDGGGIRGVFTLQILARIEELFRIERKNPDLVLADVFDMFAGTSTGAIMAAGLCWGLSVGRIERLYLDHAADMFARSPFLRRWKAKFRSERMAAIFRGIFCEDEKGQTPAELGTTKLRKLLLVVMRNASTGSPWPVTNNPRAMFNDVSRDDCNLKIPLWQLIRASTAAPTFYAPERITLGNESYLFVDGAITPYNNPALIAALMATLPCYRLCWHATQEDLLVASVGTGSTRSLLLKRMPEKVHLLDNLHYVPSALLGASGVQQDVLCRILGQCVCGPPIDLELDDLRASGLIARAEKKFTYARYDIRLDQCAELSSLPARIRASIDSLALVPHLQRIGREFAERSVSIDHLLPQSQAEVPLSTETGAHAK